MRGEAGEKNEGEVGAADFESGKGGISRLWFLKDESPKEKKGRNDREGDEGAVLASGEENSGRKIQKPSWGRWLSLGF